MHKFKAEIIDWLNGGRYEWKFCRQDGFWTEVRRLENFLFADEVRKIDEYAHLKEAYLKGKIIQVRLYGEWLDIKNTPTWNYPVEEYRIKPKPKTKKMVQWLFKCEKGNFFTNSDYYETGVKPTNVYLATPIKPLPHTEIEVDCE
jgi:hypothetical protein